MLNFSMVDTRRVLGKLDTHITVILLSNIPCFILLMSEQYHSRNSWLRMYSRSNLYICLYILYVEIVIT